MRKEYEKLREKVTGSVANKKVRIILSSQFYAEPQFESMYYKHIKAIPEYLDVYERWVLSQDPLLNIPDEDLYKLRSGIIQSSQEENDNTIKYNKKLLFFFLDLLHPFIERSTLLAIEYYKPENENLTDEQVEQIIEEISIQALNLCDKDFVEKEGYLTLSTAFMDMFKIIFFKKIGLDFMTMPDNKKDFIDTFEKEWGELSKYSDGFYGFDVVPRFLYQDIFRYLKIPFEDAQYMELRKTNTYKQAMNYIVSFASSFKPLPDPRLRIYFRNELSELFRPLVKKLVSISIRKGSFLLDKQELEDQLVKEIPKIISEFDFFFATQENLKKKKISPFQKLIFLVRGQLVKIGHNVEMDEYPLTDYLSRKLKSKIKSYLAPDKQCTELSLDRDMNNFYEDNEHVKFADTISPDQGLNNSHIPDYDAIDKDGLVLGWKTNTFCGIINKGSSTLRRWDKDNLLKPKRYTIGRKGYQTSYRAYTQEDLIKARKIDKDLKKKARHQI